MIQTTSQKREEATSGQVLHNIISPQASLIIDSFIWQMMLCKKRQRIMASMKWATRYHSVSISSTWMRTFLSSGLILSVTYSALRSSASLLTLIVRPAGWLTLIREITALKFSGMTLCLTRISTYSLSKLTPILALRPRNVRFYKESSRIWSTLDSESL